MKVSAVVSAQPVFPEVAAGSSELVLVAEWALVAELVLVALVLVALVLAALVLVALVLVAELVSVEEWALVEERAWSQGVGLDRA